MSYPEPPQGSGTAAVGPARICHALTLGLGVVIFFLGFAPVDEAASFAGASYFEVGVLFVVPSFFLLGGLLAVPGLLPRAGGSAGFLPVAGTAPAALGQLFSVFAFEGDKGTGFILILIFGLLQLAAAVAGFLLETGLVKVPSRPAYAGPPPGYWPQQGPGGSYGGQAPGGQFPPQQGPAQQYPHPGAWPGDAQQGRHG
jgi:hypothetical protein